MIPSRNVIAMIVMTSLFFRSLEGPLHRDHSDYYRLTYSVSSLHSNEDTLQGSRTNLIFDPEIKVLLLSISFFTQL